MSDTPTQLFTRSQIAAALGAAGVYRVSPKDGAYALPDRAWLSGRFAASLKHWRVNELADEPYEPDGNDCDDYAEDARYYARKSHRRTLRAAGLPVNSAIAFGECEYETEKGGGHAINVAVCREGGALVVVFWEPQTLKEVELTEWERSTACVTI